MEKPPILNTESKEYLLDADTEDYPPKEEVAENKIELQVSTEIPPPPPPQVEPTPIQQNPISENSTNIPVLQAQTEATTIYVNNPNIVPSSKPEVISYNPEKPYYENENQEKKNAQNENKENEKKEKEEKEKRCCLTRCICCICGCIGDCLCGCCDLIINCCMFMGDCISCKCCAGNCFCEGVGECCSDPVAIGQCCALLCQACDALK